MKTKQKKLLRPEEVADILKLKVGTIKAWRSRGLGPDYVKFDSPRVVRYTQEDVENFCRNEVHVGRTEKSEPVHDGKGSG